MEQMTQISSQTLESLQQMKMEEPSSACSAFQMFVADVLKIIPTSDLESTVSIPSIPSSLRRNREGDYTYLDGASQMEAGVMTAGYQRNSVNWKACSQGIDAPTLPPHIAAPPESDGVETSRFFEHLLYMDF
ncbi:predicted protein [Histoplasma capsulatum H143]|uniref:Uncharacterized protein n=1 Tax=Ajellomyces capsulatus (strain H143) TaxID=544712 RepID=C6H545_AJECH|nr:predicted protein [Histoplasma capsulatum H143]